MAFKQKLQAKLASPAITSSANSYQNNSSLSPATEAGISARQATFFSCACKQRRQKNTTLLSASLRFAPGKPASRHSVCGAAQLAARQCRFAQTNGGKSDHEATLSCGSVARSLNRVPQAQPKGMGADGLREF